MPGEYRNPRLIYRHTQNQWKSIQRRKTERGTQNSQQAEETAPNHHHWELSCHLLLTTYYLLLLCFLHTAGLGPWPYLTLQDPGHHITHITDSSGQSKPESCSWK